MAYQKFTIDNMTCSRRYHISFDDEQKEVPRVEVKCSYCDQVIFAADNYPPAKLACEENLVKTAELSDILIADCQLKDTLSEKTTKIPTS